MNFKIHIWVWVLAKHWFIFKFKRIHKNEVFDFIDLRKVKLLVLPCSCASCAFRTLIVFGKNVRIFDSGTFGENVSNFLLKWVLQ